MKFPRFYLLSLVLVLPICSSGQTARSVTILDSIYTEDFDAFGTNCPGLSTLVAPLEVNYGGITLTELEANDGSGECDDDATAYAFHYGTDGETDRAIGGKAVLGSDLEVIYYIQNNTGQTVYDVGIYYSGEQWAAGDGTTDLFMDLRIGSGATIGTVVYNDDPDGDFEDINDCIGIIFCAGAGGASDGNDAANRTKDIQATINIPLGVDNGEIVAFKWLYTTTTLESNSDDLAVDDLGFILFNDTAKTWYLLSDETVLSSNSSWTKWPNDLESTLLPNCSGLGCSDSNATFVINANQNLFEESWYLQGNNSDIQISGTPDFTGAYIELSGNNLGLTSSISLDFSYGDLVVSGDSSVVIINGNLIFSSDLFGDPGNFSTTGSNLLADINGDVELTSGIFEIKGNKSSLDVEGTFASEFIVYLAGANSTYVFNDDFIISPGTGTRFWMAGDNNVLTFKELLTLEGTDLILSGDRCSINFENAVSIPTDVFENSGSSWSTTNSSYIFGSTFSFLDGNGYLDITGDSNTFLFSSSFTLLSDLFLSGDTNEISILGVSTITANSFTVAGNRNNLNFEDDVTGSSTNFIFSGNADSIVIDANLDLTTGNYSIAGTNQYDSLSGTLSFTNGDLLLTGSDHFLHVNGAVSSSNASVFSFGGANHDIDFKSTLGFSNGGTFTVPGTGCTIDVTSTSNTTSAAFTLAGNNTDLTFGDSFTGTTGIWTIAGDDVLVTFDGTSVLGTGDVNISGTDSKFIIEDNASLKLDYDIGQSGFESDFTATVTVKNNATLFYNRYDDSSTDALSLDSCYAGSTVEFDNLEADGVLTEQNIPAVNYFNLTIKGDAFDESDKEIVYGGATTVRNNFTYERSVDEVTISSPVTFTGSPGVISTPNYSASGIFQEIIIANGASITFGSLLNGAQYQNRFEHNNLLTIQSGGTLSLLADQTLRLTTASEFSHNGVLNVPTDASLIIADSKTVSGTGLTNITRAQSATPSAAVFNHWSSPVSSASIGSGGAVNGTANYKYDNGEDDNADFQKLYAPQSMPVGKGYSALGNLTSTFVANGPSEINFGDITYSPIEQEDGDSDDENYYLVGNPYASGLSAFDFITDNASDIKGTIFLFSQVNTFGSYSREADNIAVNLLGSSALGSDSTQVDDFSDFSIASGQGFFVIDTSPETPGISIDFTESMQTGVNDNFKSKNQKSSEVKSRYWLTVNNTTNYKSTLIGFASDATLGFDNFYDAPKIPSEASLDIWSYIKNNRYEIQGLPENILATQRIPLGITVPQAGSHEINIAATDGVDNQPIYLLDVTKGKYHDLKSGPYVFLATEKGQILDRFYLMIQGQGQPVSIDDLNATVASENCIENLSANSIQSAFENHLVKRIEVYNLSGQMEFGWNEKSFSADAYEQTSKASVFKIQMANDKVCTQKLMR